jgi:rRNA-processing protein FCF1
MEISWLGDNREVKGLLLDTNVLLYAFDGIDIFEKIINILGYLPPIYVHSVVLKELENFESDKRRIGIASRARIAKLLLNKYKNLWTVLENVKNGNVDDVLIASCKKYSLWLVTSDYKLKLKAIKEGIVVLQLVRRSKRLIVSYPKNEFTDYY